MSNIIPEFMLTEEKNSVKTKGRRKGPSLRVSAPGQKRVRGRPRGNPTPLNDSEKRLRNAQYERERREAMSDAMNDLAETMAKQNDGAPPSNNAQLLQMVLEFLTEANQNPKEDISDLKRINSQLEEQIADAEQRLGLIDVGDRASSHTTRKR